MNALAELETMLKGMAPTDKAALDKTIAKELALRWRPNPGPQLTAFNCEADELFYGGQAGGGKTDLALGLSVTCHKRSLIMRRVNKDAVKMVARLEEIIGHRDGYNGQLQRWRIDGRQIEFAGCEQETDKQRFKGDPHDLIIFDEGTDFLESQYRFIKGWNRSADPQQRCRVLVTSNPPTTADGLWVIQYWAPWLDPTHPNPARPGELRWFTTIGGVDVEVDGPGPHVVEGEPAPVTARSRTFIPAALSDNPDLAETGYGSVLAALPNELRRAYRDGDFGVSMRDAAFQTIPTAWIIAAQNRWEERPPEGAKMSALAMDPAGGGKDATAIALRYGGWFAPLVTKQGDETRDGSVMAALLVLHRRDACPVVVDVGGGYGGGVTVRLKDNNIEPIPFNGASPSSERTKDGALQFVNKRAEAWWKFREELNPDQEGGSIIALPPDAELRADLAAPTWMLKASGIQLEAKLDLKVRLGRSPDRGDAVVMCWSEGQSAIVNRMGGMPSHAVRGYAKLKHGSDGGRSSGMPARAVTSRNR